ncbi:MAG: hypothetical protein ACFCUH_12265, partial [Flavobacteriales bacterium]
MRGFFIVTLFVFLASASWSQCVTIESILVDACAFGSGCGSAADNACICEGKNEMFRFRVGDNDLNVNNLNIDWPNNAFLGICQNAQTAANVAALNETITACGHLLEPVNGVLPAGSQVLVITSTDFCLEANPFTNLADTMYVLFQCPGNYSGHFANHGPPGLRTTTITFGNGCLSTVTYDRSLLITQIGTSGPEDGAGVNFTPDGTATYYNNGCTAPIIEAIVNAGNNQQTCEGQPIQINGVVSGPLENPQWTGGNGSFSNPNSPVTVYTPAPGETGPVTLTLTAEDCEGPISDTVVLTVLPEPEGEISLPDGNILCEGETLTLATTNGLSGQWSTGVTAPSIEVSEAGSYSVEIANLCGVASDEVVIFGSASPDAALAQPGPYYLCNGGSVTIESTSLDDLLWPDGESDGFFTVDEAGEYILTVTNDCGSIEVPLIVIDGGDAPAAAIINEGEGALCPGDVTILSAEGEGSYLWSTGETTPTIEVPSGSYSLTVSSSCGSSQTDIEVEAIPGAPVVIVEGDAVAVCEDGDFAIATAEGDGVMTWSNGTQGPLLVTDTIGYYVVTAVNDCGTFTAGVQVQPSSVAALFVPSSPERSLPVDLTFINLSSGGAIAFEWFVDSVSVSTVLNLTRLFNWPNTYMVALTATDAFGCSDTYSLPIEIVLEDDIVFVPNAFTP